MYKINIFMNFVVFLVKIDKKTQFEVSKTCGN
ncbi:hypothetical protein SAMN05421821_101696 [Mucilaginibacter lappiensis]|uniref:Uncharacterized protein n=1 Tax=Mucilaginibacter lappiensis TaxID=354630 RepID=A0ABR6PCB5_9SPHI|nr:hypothetical protein [Mucilaginibacter lappiensis]SIQ10456.1 hypothetical protein SAMN05421821_101696 [Mucilaginibacter lappiensis]